MLNVCFYQTLPYLYYKQSLKSITDAARPTIWLYMYYRQYFIWIRNVCLIYNYTVYTITYSQYLKSNQIKSNHLLGHKLTIFILIKMTIQLHIYIQLKYRLHSMCNHMVGRAASFVALLFHTPWLQQVCFWIVFRSWLVTECT